MTTPAAARPRTLYFDLDGTIVHAETGVVKSMLAEGRLEAAVRRVGFERLVCVANMCTIVRLLIEAGREVDGHEMILGLCQGAFREGAWFRAVTTLIPDGSCRARFIDFDGDWWWMDDRAPVFLEREGLALHGPPRSDRRLLVPDPCGDGADILAWLESVTG